jgi:hypothetical protein
LGELGGLDETVLKGEHVPVESLQDVFGDEWAVLVAAVGDFEGFDPVGQAVSVDVLCGVGEGFVVDFGGEESPVGALAAGEEGVDC